MHLQHNHIRAFTSFGAYLNYKRDSPNPAFPSVSNQIVPPMILAVTSGLFKHEMYEKLLLYLGHFRPGGDGRARLFVY